MYSYCHNHIVCYQCEFTTSWLILTRPSATDTKGKRKEILTRKCYQLSLLKCQSSDCVVSLSVPSHTLMLTCALSLLPVGISYQLNPKIPKNNVAHNYLPIDSLFCIQDQKVIKLGPNECLLKHLCSNYIEIVLTKRRIVLSPQQKL